MKKDIEELIKEAIETLCDATNEELAEYAYDDDLKDVVTRLGFIRETENIKRALEFWSLGLRSDTVPVVYLTNSLEDRNVHGLKHIAMFSAKDDIYERLYYNSYTSDVELLSWELLMEEQAIGILNRVKEQQSKTEEQMSLFLKGDK